MSATHITTAAVALFHTLAGVDHYLPFIVLSRSERWSLRRTLLWTALCGLGHVGASLALAGSAATLGYHGLAHLEARRGDLAAWILIAGGILLVLYDLVRAGTGHAHLHVHGDGTVHTHGHRHAALAEDAAQPHAHDDLPHALGHGRLFWTLFIVFVLGPCEPLVPLLVAPVAARDLAATLATLAIFSAITLAAMLGAVTLGYFGVRPVRLGRLAGRERALAGAAIAACGVLVLCGF